MTLEIFQNIDTDFFWKEQINFTIVIFDFLGKMI